MQHLWCYLSMLLPSLPYLQYLPYSHRILVSFVKLSDKALVTIHSHSITSIYVQFFAYSGHFKEIVWYYGKCAYLLPGEDVDEIVYWYHKKKKKLQPRDSYLIMKTGNRKQISCILIPKGAILHEYFHFWYFKCFDANTFVI